MNIFTKLRAYLRYCEAVRQAEKAHKETGKRYYVLPNGKTEKLIIVDRNNFRKLRMKHYVKTNNNYKVMLADVARESFYCTPYKNGNGKLTSVAKRKKLKQYFNWIEKCNQ